MRRRQFVRLLGGSAFAWLAGIRLARAQQTTRFSRLGVMVTASPPHPFADLLRQGLQGLGYAEGRNITLDVRYTEGRSDRAREIATEFARSGVDIIVAHFTPAVRAAMAATQTIPIVMAPAGAPLQTGFIKSLAQPGGNVTGLSAMDAEIGGKRIQLLRDLIPNLACVGVLATTPTTDPYAVPYVADISAAAAAAGVRFAPVQIGGPSEFEEAFAELARAKAQAVIVQPFFDPHAKALLQLANKHRIAYMSSGRAAVADGGLVSISANFLLLYERAAGYVDRIIKGASPVSLPVEQPSKFQVVVNSKTAQALGLTISPSLLAQIDEVID
jgi:putative tryptophan/tyrosine transport system substrate-binding protein